MLYTKREQLTVLELQEERDTLSCEELTAALTRRPSEVVYIEVNGLLYGIVTTGRILRAKQAQLSEVKIRKDFKFVHENTYIYIYIRQMMRNSSGRNRFLPVVDSDGKLLGDYSEYDNQVFSRHFSELAAKLRISPFARAFRYAILRPQNISETALHWFQEWTRHLEEKGVPLEVIGPERLFDGSDDFDYIVSSDGRQLAALQDLSNISRLSKAQISQKKTIGCLQLLLVLSDPAEEILQSLQKQGVCVMTYSFEEDGTGYFEEFSPRIYERFCALGGKDGPLPPRMRADFLGELTERFEGQKLPFPMKIYLQGDIYKMRDQSGALFNVRDGKRETAGQPEEFEHTIHIYGCCMMYGIFTDDEHTIPSLLQKKINEAGLPYRVENDGAIIDKNIMLDRILATPLKRGDVIIYFKYTSPFLGAAMGRKLKGTFRNCNVTGLLKEKQPPITWFEGSIHHCNHKVHQLIADAFYEMLLPVLPQLPPPADCGLVEQSRDIIGTLYLNRYFSDFDPTAYGSVGSIVMNCNPFTFGHRYLIEEALKRVEFLIIFVVEEDLSIFPFRERFSMVCAGTADLENVMVVPSGEFILSSLTFPEYFVKKTDEEIVENTENDIRLFAEKIAPRLGITHRFVGEELEDQVTAAYNQAMKRVLPPHGIQVVEIPRKQNGSEVISASKVRKCLEENDMETLDKLVPASTKEIIRF